MQKQVLAFSLYISSIFRLGKWGNFFCLGPFYFTKTLYAIDRETTQKPILERVIDYEYLVEKSGRTDRFILHLNNGTTVERKFSRIVTSIEKDIETTKQTNTSLSFSNKLKEICGY